MGWHKHQSDSDEPSCYYPANWDVYETALAQYEPNRGGWEWHLTSAGAFEVMVEMDTIRLVRYDDETWRSELYARNEFFWHESPHKAVELAAIALLDA